MLSKKNANKFLRMQYYKIKKYEIIS